MFQLVLQPLWFQPVSFTRAHGLTVHAPVKGCCSLMFLCVSVGVRAHLVGQVKQVGGKNVPRASYPSGCGGLKDTDTFRLVVCLQSPG